MHSCQRFRPLTTKNFLVTCERVRLERSSLAFDQKVLSKNVPSAMALNKPFAVFVLFLVKSSGEKMTSLSSIAKLSPSYLSMNGIRW